MLNLLFRFFVGSVGAEGFGSPTYALPGFTARFFKTFIPYLSVLNNTPPSAVLAKSILFICVSLILKSFSPLVIAAAE